MKIRYLLDGNIINESPDGWEKRKTSIKHDRVLKGRLISEDATLEWFADGYEYIKSVFDNDITGEIKIQIQIDLLETGTWVTDYFGLLKMPDCQFNISPNYVKTAILDDSFYSRIANNRAIKTTVKNTKSKNDVIIDLPDEKLINFFRPVDGVYGISGRKAYTIYQCFKYMIAFMSDDEVGFISETFNDDNDTIGEYGKFVVILGIEIRLGASNTKDFLELDFAELYNEVDKKFNIGFRIERIDGKPYMRIEKATWFYKNTTSTRFDYLRDIKRGVDNEYLYSTIGLGSDDTVDAVSLSFAENGRWFGFLDEQFYLLGKTNIDRTLDLKSRWILSSNVIEDILMNNAKQYDENIFFVQVLNTFSSTIFAYQSNWFAGAPPYYYNEQLSNQHVTERWLDGIPKSVVAQLGVANRRFKAIRPQKEVNFLGYSPNPGGIIYSNIQEPWQFKDDYTPPLLYDSSNSYGNGTTQGLPVAQADSRFTAPAAGIFVFEITHPLKVYYCDINITITVKIELKRYNSAGTLLITHLHQESRTGASSGIYWLNFKRGIVMNSSDYVEIKKTTVAFSSVYFPGTHVRLQELENATFGCTYASIDEGGEFTIGDITNQRYMKYVAKNFPITHAQLDSIKNDTAQSIEINTDGKNNYIGWIDSLIIDRLKGTVDCITRGRRIDEPINP